MIGATNDLQIDVEVVAQILKTRLKAVLKRQFDLDLSKSTTTAKRN